MQGQSAAATEIKQRGLTLVFRIGLSVAQRPRFKAGSYNYFHFDLNAGSGFNEEAGCSGSPITFLREAAARDCQNFIAYFCDYDAKQVEKLKSHPAMADTRCHVVHMDNRELVARIPDLIRHHNERPFYAKGSILSDPNGSDVPLEELSLLTQICPTLDVVFHWNSIITKRLRNGIKPNQVMLRDVPKIIHKKYWIIRKPVGIHQFVVLIGRNMPGGEWKKMGYYRLESPEGQEINDVCSTTIAERATRSAAAD